jgi:protocatechuate 3,4-dioxygenase beta subunit
MIRKSFLIPLFALGLLMPLARAEDKAATGTVTGKVVDADGKGVAGATVGLYAPGANAKKASGAATISKSAAQLADEPAPAPKKKGGGAAIVSATTGDDGAYKLENVPAGEYSIRVRSASGNGHSKGTITVKAGETVAAPDITVKPKKA